MQRQLLTEEEFVALKSQSKAEILAVLSRYVQQPKGRPASDTPRLTPAEKQRRYRERKRQQV